MPELDGVVKSTTNSEENVASDNESATSTAASPSQKVTSSATGNPSQTQSTSSTRTPSQTVRANKKSMNKGANKLISVSHINCLLS